MSPRSWPQPRVRVVATFAVAGLVAAGAACGRGRAPAPASAGRAATTPPTAASSSVSDQPTTPAPSTTPVPRTAAAPPTTAPKPFAGRVVAIDPGHDGANGTHPADINKPVPAGPFTKACDTTGTATDSGYTESAYNFDVALRLKAILEGAGIKVVLTRLSDTGVGPCVNQRAAIGNAAGADAAISIHADGGPPGGRGFHVIQPALLAGYTDGIVAPSRQLALAVRARYLAGTGMPYATYIGNAGLDTRGDLGGLNLSKVPKVFIECGNMRNATDAGLLTSVTFRQQAAGAIALGLEDFLRSLGPAKR